MVSRKNLGKTAGWITQPQTMIGNWVGQQIGTGIKGGVERIQNKGQNFSVNNYKSNLNLPTYNSRYPGFDEADYKKLEQGAINRGLTGEQKTQFMDEAYQYYYPQVLNKHGLDKRAEEINKIASENGQSILNGDKNVSRNLKLVDLAQTAKRVKGFAYDYPDEQIIEAMKTEIPDGEQLILNYLNNGDDTILYKAGLKKTDAQIQLDNYNKNKESINKALIGNWRELSDNGIKYLNNYTTLYNIVDEARQEGMGQGMTDNDLLLNLAYLSPEIQQIVNETENLTLDNEDKAIFGMLDKDSVRQDWDNTKQNIRDFLGWNSETPATLNDIAEEMYVRENRGGQAVKNAKANWRTFGDTLAKFGYRLPRDIQNLSLEADLKLGGNLSQEDVDRIKTKIGINKQEVQAFNEATDKDQQSYKNQIGLDPIIENYYSKQGLFESLLNEKGFGYKSLGEVTSNIDMLAGIGGSIINPVLGLAIMGTDTFARENQDAFETLMNAQMKQGASYEDAYNNAVKGGIVVGGLNTVIELGLEKFLGGVETSTAKNIKEWATRDLNKEVSEMITKRGILEMLGKGLETQARSSLEEGMEEVFQQLVSNIAESGYDPDKQISEGLWRAFESGALNPMNLLAGGSELLNGGSLSEADKQTLIEWANSLSISNPIQGAYNPKSIVENIKNGTSNITSNTQGIFDRITDWGAEKITDTVSPQDKLYKAQEPLMQTLTKRKDLEKKRGNSDRANQLILENGFMPTDTSSRLEAHDTTMKNIWQQIEDKINGGKEIMIDLSEISNVLDEFIAKQKRTKSTLFDTDLERLSKESAALRGQQISLPDVERLKQGYNAKINNWGDEKVSDVMANGLREATHKIGVIEDNLLSEIPGQFQALKNDFGALKDTYEDVFKADMRNQRRKGGTLAETYSRIEGISDIVNGVLGTLTGKGDLQSIAKGGAKILVGKSLAKAKNVDFLIEQGFKGLAEELGIGGAITDNNIIPTTPTNPTDTVISENVNETAGNQAQELYNQGDNNLSPNSEQMETTKKTTKKISKKQQYLNDADYLKAQTEWYDNWRHDLENGEERWTDYTDEYNQMTEDEHQEWVRNRFKEIVPDMPESEINRLERNWNKLGEDEKLNQVQKYRKDTADWSPAGEIEDTDEENDFSDQGWVDENIDEDALEDQGVKRYADEAYRPSITMKVDDYINEDSEEVSVRDMIRQDSMPKKGVSIEEQLRQVENNNVTSVDDWKKEFVFEQYDDDDLKNELKTAKKRYKEFSNKWKEEGSYYNRDQAANYLNKIDAINERLGNNSKTKKYADEAYRPSITMKVDDYISEETKTTKTEAKEKAEEAWEREGWKWDEDKKKWFRYKKELITYNNKKAKEREKNRKGGEILNNYWNHTTEKEWRTEKDHKQAIKNYVDWYMNK